MEVEEGRSRAEISRMQVELLRMTWHDQESNMVREQVRHTYEKHIRQNAKQNHMETTRCLDW